MAGARRTRREEHRNENLAHCPLNGDGGDKAEYSAGCVLALGEPLQHESVSRGKHANKD